MKNIAIILAAGNSTRFGADKLSETVAGRTLWQHSLEAFLRHPMIDGVGLVASQSILEEAAQAYPDLVFAVLGGETRSHSALAGLMAVPAGPKDGYENALIHDAARPYVSADVISRVCRALETHVAVLPAIPVTDTVHRAVGNSVEPLPREQLLAAQTPQGARLDLLLRAHQEAHLTGSKLTDDIGLLQAMGVEPFCVEGDPENIKVTHRIDLRGDALRESPSSSMYTVTGFGYDTHRFSDDSTRPCWLGCLHLAGEQALEGHSDADVIAHAVVDALLGAASLGDIGQLFPNDAPENKDRRSADFLTKAADLLQQQGAQIVHIDATYLGEKPKISNHTPRMREAIAEALGIDPAKVSLKATTNEKLGSIGAGEGAAAFAVATIRREGE